MRVPFGSLSEFLAAVAAVAAAYAAWKLNQLEHERRQFDENVIVVTQLSTWATYNAGGSGVWCATALSNFSQPDLKRYSLEQSYTLSGTQQEQVKSCLLTMDAKQEIKETLSREQRKKLYDEYSKYTNSYETLALAWFLLSDGSRKIICEQAGIPPGHALRQLVQTAQGTPLWNFRYLEKFMSGCPETK